MIEKRRDELKPGDVFASSHGYDVLVGKVQDTAEVRTDERHVGIVGYLHGDPANSARIERYEASSTVEVYSLIEFATELMMRATARFERGMQMIEAEARPNQIVMQFTSAANGYQAVARLVQWGQEMAHAESYTLGGVVAEVTA